MAVLRWIIGRIILGLDWLTRPARPRHAADLQARLDAATGDLELYEFEACPFCVKTRRAVQRLGLNIRRRDARRDPQARDLLVAQGGKLQVPCLRIPAADGTTRWLYESDDIIAYLRARYDAVARG